MRATFVALFVFLTTACNNNLPKQSIVDKLRVLAVQANPAELLVGGSLPAATLTALAIEPSAAPIELTWALCPLPANLPPPEKLAHLAERLLPCVTSGADDNETHLGRYFSHARPRRCASEVDSRPKRGCAKRGGRRQTA